MERDANSWKDGNHVVYCSIWLVWFIMICKLSHSQTSINIYYLSTFKTLKFVIFISICGIRMKRVENFSLHILSTSTHLRFVMSDTPLNWVNTNGQDSRCCYSQSCNKDYIESLRTVMSLSPNLSIELQ